MMQYIQEYDKKKLLIGQAEKYEDMNYFKTYPIAFPKQYPVIQDIEISGFISAYLAFGNRKQIVKKCEELDEIICHSPYTYLVLT